MSTNLKHLEKKMKVKLDKRNWDNIVIKVGQVNDFVFSLG